MVQTANGTGADLKNLGQGSNQRALRRPDPNGNDVARYKDTTASANQHFYWSTKIMWDDWRKRERADPEMASQGCILPRPFDFIQAEMIESGVGGHRMQLHDEKEEKRPDSTWIGGLGKLPYFRGAIEAVGSKRKDSTASNLESGKCQVCMSNAWEAWKCIRASGNVNLLYSG